MKKLAKAATKITESKTKQETKEAGKSMDKVTAKLDDKKKVIAAASSDKKVVAKVAAKKTAKADAKKDAAKKDDAGEETPAAIALGAPPKKPDAPAEGAKEKASISLGAPPSASKLSIESIAQMYGVEPPATAAAPASDASAVKVDAAKELTATLKEA